MSSEKYPRKKPNILLISLGKRVLGCAIIQEIIFRFKRFFMAVLRRSPPHRPVGPNRRQRRGSPGRPGPAERHLRADRADAEGRHRGCRADVACSWIGAASARGQNHRGGPKGTVPVGGAAGRSGSVSRSESHRVKLEWVKA